MDVTLLNSIAGIALSLAFSYIPGLSDWFGKLKGDYKRLIMLGMLLVVSGSMYGLSCANWWPTLTCNKEGIKKLIEVFILAAVANQTAFALSPQKETPTFYSQDIG